MLSKLIDVRNLDLWEDLNAWREIGIEYNDNSWYSCYTGPNRITIYLNRQIISPGGFTHELLHIWFYRKEIYVSQSLQVFVRDIAAVRKVMSRELVDHVGNCLDHIKMLPKYSDMGFGWEEFTTDVGEEKLTVDEIRSIKAGMSMLGLYDARGVDFFIGKFIAAAACPNPLMDYGVRFNELRNVEPALFGLLNDFVVTWKAFDIDGNDPCNSYLTVLSNFLDALESWVNQREFFNKIR